jgi:medium-chain acyl-[acyl-carrier-protein] hydrolase
MSSMNAGMKADAPSWLAFHKVNPQAALRLFCFHYAGGSAQVFQTWHDLLPTVEVCPVQLPGRGNRIKEGSISRIVPLVEQLAREISPKLDMPYAFFGHSMGALVCFELARLLRRERGSKPAHLFVSGRHAPQLPDTSPPVHNLPDEEFIERLRDYNNTPEAVLRHPELMGLMLPFLRADFELCETYVYQPDAPFDCPLTAFGGLGDGGLRREALEAWREHTTGQFSLRMFPGEHFFINDSRPLLLQVLARELYLLTQRQG